MVKDETRLSRLFELQDAVAQARAELAAHVQLEDEGPTAATQRRAFATVSQMTDRCECLHMELSGARMPVRDKGIGGAECQECAAVNNTVL